MRTQEGPVSQTVLSEPKSLFSSAIWWKREVSSSVPSQKTPQLWLWQHSCSFQWSPHLFCTTVKHKYGATVYCLQHLPPTQFWRLLAGWERSALLSSAQRFLLKVLSSEAVSSGDNSGTTGRIHPYLKASKANNANSWFLHQMFSVCFYINYDGRHFSFKGLFK